jgi:hypothetical protein
VNGYAASPWVERVKARFDWSDHDIADALGVWPSTVSRYRVAGVPDGQIRHLRQLDRMSVKDVPKSRRSR